MFKQYRLVQTSTGAFDVVMYREEDGEALRTVVRQLPAATAVEVAGELDVAFRAGMIAGSAAHMKSDVDTFLEESAERLRRRFDCTRKDF